MPSAFGLLQGGRVETGAGGGTAAGAACGAAAADALGAGSACDHAALDANSETAPARINPVAIRILFSLNSNLLPVATLPSSGAPMLRFAVM